MVASMKVLHIVKTAVGANWAYEQVRVLCSLGIEVVVALPSDTEGLAPKYRQAGATVVRANLDFPAREPWRIPATLRACRRLVADVRPDLIHTHHVGPTFVARLALEKNSPIPRIFGVTGTLHLEHDFFAWLDTHLAGPRDYWVATCQWTQRKYETLGIPLNRVFLAYLGTDLKNYPSNRTGILRKELKIPADVPLVGMVSLLYPPKWYLGSARGHKGHEDFITALARLRQERPDVRGVMIGGTWGDGRWYEHRVRHLGKRICGDGLYFSGTRTDIATIYPDLDLAVVPTHSDGLAYSVVEPLLADVPVVATNVGGIPDLIRDGDTGWLVPPQNPEALARAMLDALESPEEARRRTARGRELTRHLLDLEKTGREVAAVYEKVLEVPAPRLADRIESTRQIAAVQSDAAVRRSQLPSTEV
jgi:glycosyltransferase involved in cell wall biosynthesis